MAEFKGLNRFRFATNRVLFTTFSRINYLSIMPAIFVNDADVQPGNPSRRGVSFEARVAKWQLLVPRSSRLPGYN